MATEIEPQPAQDQSTIGVSEKISHRLKVLKEDMSSGCLSKYPSACILALCALIVAAIIVAIPVIFFIFSSSASKMPPMRNELSQAHRMVGSWPKMDKIHDLPEDGDVDGEFRGIPMGDLFPANVSACFGFGFACSNNVNHVIPTTKRCDGVYDCHDKSDEDNCHECQSVFSCAARSGAGEDLKKTKLGTAQICLTAQQLCDGVQHCPDGSDETKWCKSECSSEEFQCAGQNVCLPSSARCNGIVDCNDGADEEKCDACNGGALSCDKKCVEPSKICDGVTDCSDGEDEKDCDCKACSGSDKALCDDGTCILRSAICDGKRDCADGMDETDCPGTCTAADKEEKKSRERLTCSDGRSYLRSEACSGEFEVCAKSCEGGCDEKTAFTCPTDGKCVPKRMVCDGVVDCSDGEDEKDCSCDDENTFKCETESKCYSGSQKCDGINDCYDSSDEKDCEECPSEAFTCSVDRTCLPASARCNGISECTDGADETDCTCDECVGAHSTTYMCDGTARCLKREDVCNPYSTCPNATRIDRAYCANLMIKNKNLYPW